MKKFLWSLISILLICSPSFADDSSTVNYYGQESDVLTLDTINTVTRYRDRVVDSTCTRQIPYQTQECGNETRYRQECNYRQGRNVCQTTYQRVCHNERRTRRECRNQPGRRRCHMTRPTRICRNGRCHTEPARQICEDGPGRQVCRNIDYNEPVCRQEPRQSCHYEPGRNVCTDVPYQQYVCHDVTRYRSETYACRRTIQEPYQVDRKVSADVTIDYKGAIKNAQTKLNFQLLESGKIILDVEDHSPVSKLVAANKDLSIDAQDNETNTSGKITFRFYNKSNVLAPVQSGINSVGISQKELRFNIGKVTHANRIKVQLKIVRDGLFSSPKTILNKSLSLGQFALTNSADKSRVTVDLSQFGVSLKRKKYEVTIKVSLDYNAEFLNLDPNQNLSTQAFFKLKP